MKIKEYKSLNIFLNKIFGFFKERELSTLAEMAEVGSDVLCLNFICGFTVAFIIREV